ncbi:hypothetical protein Belba_3135 [Belliella baltica DSM 15883]|uniref:Uncharacterized protein n=1 Tax=Belliella baltica (strain DSM 15883 / CIP 108006 / LMG 21964 / BA134) TaxID=866536 RepID=I3Z8T1_BELBD|nr:hypothetical protein [Belliella baltica]AFL85649.1 hypothetical protein Belba_3135 [Belliella baltica DSM 15883]
MELIKSYFIKNHLQKISKTKQDKIIIPNEISSIAIIANTEEELKSCEESLAVNFGESVEISIYYFSKKDEEFGISSKDFNLFGQPKERIKRFLEKKVDFILTPSLNLNPYLLYLLLHSKTGLRVGFWSLENKEFLDLMLDQKENSLKENIQNLLDYLIKIKAAC